MAGILKCDQVQSDSNLSFQVAGANVAYMNSTGLQMTGSTLSLGGTTVIPAVGQIKFPASQNASSDPNTLDDYEEGTWTPTIQGGTTGGTTTYTSQQGFYTKIGKLVTCSADLGASATTGTGTLRIGNLPFTSLLNYQGVCPVMVESYNWSGGSYMQLYIGSSRNYLIPYVLTDDGAWAGQSMTNEQQNFIFTISYITDN